MPCLTCEPMADLDLIRQLGDLLGRPLEEISEERFERHAQAKYARDGAKDRITRDAYCLASNGTVSGLFLQPVTSELLFDLSFEQICHVRYLYLDRVNLLSYSFLSDLKGLTSLDLSDNKIKTVAKDFAKGRFAITTEQYKYTGVYQPV